MRKRISLWAMTLFAALVIAMAFSGNVKAGELQPVKQSPDGITSKYQAVSDEIPSTPAKGSFGVYEYNLSTGKVWLWYTCPNEAVTIQFQVYKNNSLIKTGYFNGLSAGQQFYGSDPIKIVRNAVYKYRIRGYNIYGETGAWSAFRYISVPTIKSKAKSRKKGFYVTTTKNTRVKQYCVYVSKTLNGTYKYTRTIKPNKKRTTRITKNYKKKKVNYFKVFSFVKVGKTSYKSDIPYHGKIYVFK